MPSRKKARGRQNRAKKEATRTADQRSLWEPTILRNNSFNIANRKHLLAILPSIPQEGPAISYMNCLAGEGFFDKATHFSGDILDMCFRPLEHFPGVQKDDTERSLATDLLLRFVRNVFLHDSMMEGESWFHDRAQNEVAICCTINVLQLLGTYSDPFVAKKRADKMVNRMVLGNRRDTVKFVAKRVPCTCLKELQSATRKKVAKVGQCFGCYKRFPRSELHVCTGCMLNEYCSKECQRANWSHHKPYCGNPEVMRSNLPGNYVLE